MTFGDMLAVSGSVLSVVGALYNNLKLRHNAAMKIWMCSNILLLAWAVGYVAGWWDGGLSGMALVGMYTVYAVSNIYGLMKKQPSDPAIT